jgi:hypothetical protein
MPSPRKPMTNHPPVMVKPPYGDAEADQHGHDGES